MAGVHIALQLVPLRVEMSWPAKSLSPNARVHFMQLHAAKKVAKEEAFWATRAALPAHFQWTGGKLDVAYTFCPPDNRKRDLDNAIAATKALSDGIAQALRVDDSIFRLSYAFGDVVPRGRVLVQIGGGEE